MHDAIIIGGGFAGLAAALQLGRARRNVLVLDTGRPRNRFAAHSHGFFSRDGAPPLELLTEARAQLAPYTTVSVRQGGAVAAARIDGGFAVDNEGGDTLRTKTLVLAHGIVDEVSGLPGLADCWGRTVFTCPFCHGFEFADRPLGVLWRIGDIVHHARLYRNWSRNLTVFADGRKIDEASREALAELGVAIVEAPVLALEHEDGNLRAVVTDAGRTTVEAMFTHPAGRFSTSIGLDLGCETRDGAAAPYYVVDMMQQTSVAGVFAAGDVARQAPSISFAVADGVMAGSAVHHALMSR